MQKFDRQKIYEMLLTAFFAALIAFLQNLLSSMGHSTIAPISPVDASVVGALLKIHKHIV